VCLGFSRRLGCIKYIQGWRINCFDFVVEIRPRVWIVDINILFSSLFASFLSLFAWRLFVEFWDQIWSNLRGSFAAILEQGVDQGTWDFISSSSSRG